MGRIRRTPQSKVDYLEIWFHVANDNKEAADLLLRTFDKALHHLSDMPGMGQMREDIAPNLRSFPVGNYLIFYRASDCGGIELLRVIHGARDLRRAFRQQ